ncbi:transposase [Corynebacterium cystitidis]|uniref:transposase n=1 Tax=Corynebacterium cystitidis TaxID=35757 RepID=UPI00211E62F2|nr:transposase [Corynebacterium cystitidis]
MPRMYSPQFRQQCVDAVLTLGKKRADVATEYEIAKSTLDRWIAQETGTLGTGSGSHRKAGDPDSDDPQEMAKIIAELRKENEFLKKQQPCLPRRSNRRQIRSNLPLRRRRPPQPHLHRDYDVQSFTSLSLRLLRLASTP